jgi:FKBP-type peptidyl-prolyl cis-trans isomerase SlyD
MKVEKNKQVSIAYKISEDEPNGEILVEITEEDPEVILYDEDMENLVFYSRLKGLSAGESFSFVLEPEDAFGEYDEDEIVDSDLDNFAEKTNVDAKDITEDMYFTYNNDEGETDYFRVKSVNHLTNKITLDFNHPYAGKRIKVEGKIIDVRDPEEK